MATIGDLLDALDDHIQALPAGLPATLDDHQLGWIRLARSVQRALPWLGLDQRSDHAFGSLSGIVDKLARPPLRDLDPDAGPVAELVRPARLVGAVADILADRSPSIGDRGGNEAVKLEASLLAHVHVLARWSLTELIDERTRQASPLRRSLRELAMTTQPWSLIPPAQRSSLLELQRLPNPSEPGLTGATAAWATEATRVLTERYQATGWAMQAIAGSLAMICTTAQQAIDSRRREGLLPDEPAWRLSAAFGEAGAHWSRAAAWPPHLRLGGSTRTLRGLTRDLREHVTGPAPLLADLHHVLNLLRPVAHQHVAVLERMVFRNELWVHASAIGALGRGHRGWFREPRGSLEGLSVLRAAQAGTREYEEAVGGLASAGRSYTHPSSRPTLEMERDPSAIGLASMSMSVVRHARSVAGPVTPSP